jgi:arginyl-tRNA--protein-N-Asp/Glu arginylyltransferase
VLDAPSRCEYLPKETWQLRRELFPDLDAAGYEQRLRDGWRRFGPMVFRPECPSCRQCRSLRVPTASFRPDESQRRAWRRNQDDVALRIGTPIVTADRLDLFRRFHEWKHEAQGWPAAGGDNLDVFLENPFPTEEWTYYADGRLIAVGYVDALPAGLSAIYFFWDPHERRRSLGTFNIVTMLRTAAERRLPHVYLGYFVRGCRSLEYKARFQPNEVLTIDGRWAPLTGPA